MVNHFLLQGMEYQTATMDKDEFAYTLLMGYMERMVDRHGKLVVQETASEMFFR